jgi:Domain of unknown function (DUF4381)
MADPADLSNLRDIVLPAEVSLWPRAPGWWIVGVAGLAAAAILAAMAVVRYRRNGYRREALHALATAEAQEISTVLKRAALAAWPREQVASLSGTAWLAFLDRAGDTTDFTSGAGRHIAPLAFGGAVGEEARTAAFAAARSWIRHHRRGRATPEVRSSLRVQDEKPLEWRAPSKRSL